MKLILMKMAKHFIESLFITISYETDKINAELNTLMGSLHITISITANKQ